MFRNILDIKNCQKKSDIFDALKNESKQLRNNYLYVQKQDLVLDTDIKIFNSIRTHLESLYMCVCVYVYV